MSSQASSSKNIIDNLQKQAYEVNIGTREAPDSPTSHSESAVADTESPRFSDGFDIKLSHSQTQLFEELVWQSQGTQFLTSARNYDLEIQSSAEDSQGISNPHSPETAPIDLIPQAEALSTYGQLEHHSNQSQPVAPSAAMEHQPGAFYTPPVEMAPSSSIKTVPIFYVPSDPQPVPIIFRSSQRPRRHHSDTAVNRETRRKKLWAEVIPEIFIANDPFDYQNDFNEEMEKLTFDDIDLTPTTENPQEWGQLWGQLQDPQNPPMEAWNTAPNIPSSWGHLYSPHASNLNFPKVRPYTGQQTADESTTNAPIANIVSEVPPPGDGEHRQHSPVVTQQISPLETTENAIGGDPGKQVEQPVPDVSSDVYPQRSPPQTHLPNGPTNMETTSYPSYPQMKTGRINHQIQIGQINEPLVPANMPVRSSFWTSLKDFLRWPFTRGTSQSRQEFELPYHMHLAPTHTPKPMSKFTGVVVQLFLTTLPRQVYLHFLLRLPSFYFSRVARIFEEADLTLREIKKMALETGLAENGPVDLYAFETNKGIPPQYSKLKSTWEAFIDSVMREWKTLNLISVLLLSAILTMLQIPGAAQNPLTRYTSLASLICSLMSLLFGCTYIIRFGTMRKTYKAAEWALEAQQTRTTVWWNVWVLLAMPAVWLTWSIMLFTACIMSFVWQSSVDTDQNPPNPISGKSLLIIRIAMSSLLGLGMVYGILILSTFRRYGRVMDRAWKRRIHKWVEQKNLGNHSNQINNPEFESGPQNSILMFQGGSPVNLPFYPAQATAFGVYSQGTLEDFLPSPILVDVKRFQLPNVTSDTPAPSKAVASQPTFSGTGYFSEAKSPESVAASLISLNDDGHVHNSNNKSLSGPTMETTSPSRSNHDKSERELGLEPSSLPTTPRRPSSIAEISIHGTELPQDQNDDPDPTHDRARPRGRSKEIHGLHNVRFRSPLTSPEVTQFEGSGSGQNEETLDSALSVLPAGGLLMTTRPSTPDGPEPTHREPSTNIHQSLATS